VRRFNVRRVPVPGWARTPDVWLNMKLSDYQAIQSHRERMLEVIHRMVDDHLNRTGYVAEARDVTAPGLEAFPSAGGLSGEYYIGDESYEMEVGPVRFAISIMARCLSGAVQRDEANRDYLGLEAWLECSPDDWDFKPVTHLNVSVI
jgi:hypothetical protein